MKSAHSFKLCLLLDKGLVAWMERGLHCDLMSPIPKACFFPGVTWEDTWALRGTWRRLCL